MRNSTASRTPEKVAHDLARYDRREQVREAAVRQKISQKARPVTKKRMYPAMRVSALSILFFVVFVASLLLIVSNFMQITIITSQHSELAAEYNKLKSVETTLKKGYESKLKLDEIAQYAETELGMIKPQEQQIIYVDLSGEDHGVVYDDNGVLSLIKKAFSTVVSNIVEYLS